MKRLKELRKERGVTQEDLAKFLNVKRNAISRYETDDREPDHDVLIKIAQFFNVSIDYLLGNSETNITSKALPDPDHKAILSSYDSLSDKNKAELIRIARLLEIEQKIDKNKDAEISGSLTGND